MNFACVHRKLLFNESKAVSSLSLTLVAQIMRFRLVGLDRISQLQVWLPCFKLSVRAPNTHTCCDALASVCARSL